MVYVGLNNVRVWQGTRGRKRRLNRNTQIDADNLTRAPTCREHRVTPFTTTAFKHDLVTKKLGRNRRDPTEELFGVTLVFLGEVLPLPAKTFGRLAFVALDMFEIREARNAGGNRKRRRTRRTAQLALHDLSFVSLSDREIESSFTRWTDEIRE